MLAVWGIVEKANLYFFALDRDQRLGDGALAPLPMAYRMAVCVDGLITGRCCRTASLYMVVGRRW